MTDIAYHKVSYGCYQNPPLMNQMQQIRSKCLEGKLVSFVTLTSCEPLIFEEDVFQVFLCHFHFHDSDENEGLPVALTGQQLLGCHPCLRG